MTSTKPPIHPNPSMDQQPKARPQSESDFFYDGASMRAPVPGTVARGELREDRAFFEGKDASGSRPRPLAGRGDAGASARGADRYNIYVGPATTRAATARACWHSAAACRPRRSTTPRS